MSEITFERVWFHKRIKRPSKQVETLLFRVGFDQPTLVAVYDFPIYLEK